MKDVKRTVLWVLVGFCMISVVMGIFSLFGCLQMSTTKITQIGLNEEESTFFMANTLAAILCTIAGVAFVFVAIMKFLKNSVNEKPNLILGLLIAALAICVVFIVYSFIMPAILKAGNDTFDSFNSYDKIYYSTFLHYQTYLSAVLSAFLPLFIAAGLVLGNVICRIKFQKPETVETAAPENN